MQQPKGYIVDVFLAAYSGLSKGTVTPYPYEDDETPEVVPVEKTSMGPPTINGVITESDIEEIKERSQSMSRHKSNPSRDSGFLDGMSSQSGEEGQSPPDSQDGIPQCSAGTSSGSHDIPSGEKLEIGSSDTNVAFCLGDIDENDVEKDSTNEKASVSPISKERMRLDLADTGRHVSQHHSLRMAKSPSTPAMSLNQPSGTPVDPPKRREDCPFWCPPVYAQVRHFAQSPVLQFRHMPIATNPYMSPFLAPAELICKMPKVCFMVS